MLVTNSLSPPPNTPKVWHISPNQIIMNIILFEFSFRKPNKRSESNRNMKKKLATKWKYHGSKVIVDEGNYGWVPNVWWKREGL